MSQTQKFASAVRRLLGALVLVATSAITAFAQNGHGPINVDDNGVILRGYDAVAYQTQQQAVQGTPRFTAVHDGAIYQFATATNRDAFKENPAKYAPVYGGYCAMGVAVNKKLDGDPTAFSIVGGRLYLNVNSDVRAMWGKDPAGNNAKAERNWTRIASARGFDRM